MTATVIPFRSRPAEAPTITAQELQEAARWAARMGGGWSAGRVPTEQPGVQGLEVGRDGELEWQLERCAEGVGLFDAAGETLGIWPTVGAALAGLEEELAAEALGRP